MKESKYIKMENAYVHYDFDESLSKMDIVNPDYFEYNDIRCPRCKHNHAEETVLIAGHTPGGDYVTECASCEQRIGWEYI